jgi:hypothetical protein
MEMLSSILPPPLLRIWGAFLGAYGPGPLTAPDFCQPPPQHRVGPLGLEGWLSGETKTGIFSLEIATSNFVNAWRQSLVSRLPTRGSKWRTVEDAQNDHSGEDGVNVPRTALCTAVTIDLGC